MVKSESEILHERLKAALDAGDDRLAGALSDARAADLAELFGLLRDEDRSRVLFALPPHLAAEVVVMLDEGVRGDLVEDLDTESLTEIVSELPPDDAADVLAELPSKEAGVILDHMEDTQSGKIEELLEYGEETAGGIMTPDVVAVPASKTVADAVEFVREATQDEDLHEIYIVDGGRRLIGTVPLRRLVTRPPQTKLEDICDREPVTVLADDDQETVVQIFRKYDCLSAAVVDEQDRLLGRITHDDLLDVAVSEAAEDLYRMAGTDPAEFETRSVFHAARIRLTWLLPCMLGTLITATILAMVKAKVNTALFATLWLFSPMIAAISGNSGIQISTVIVRGFATGDVRSNRFARVFVREGRIALLISLMCGLAAFGLVSLVGPWFQSLQGTSGQVTDPTRLAFAVGSAMICAILVAGNLGIALPFVFRGLGIDPAIASGPLVTTTNDTLSVSIYLSLGIAFAT